MTHPETHDVIMLGAAGVSLVLDLGGGAIPAVVHWGADLGFTADATDLRRVVQRPHVASEVDAGVRVSLLPEHGLGWMGTPGVSGSRRGADWSPAWAPVACVIEQETPGGPGTVRVTAADAVTRLRVSVTIELTPQGVVRTRATLRNDGDEEYALDALTLALPVPARASDVVDFAGWWAGERALQRQRFTVGTHRREGRRGRRGLDATPLMFAVTPDHGFDSGEVWGVHTAWSGNHVHQAERMLGGEQVLGGGELLLPGEILLAPGEEYTSPWIYGVYGAGFDAAAARLHEMLRARPTHPASPRPVTLNVWEAVYFAHDVAVLSDLAREAAAIGVERYVLDDGWFGGRRGDHAGLGDWYVSPDVWPDGLHPLVDLVHDLGMQFGLWFEPEMVNLDSDLARAHPEWILQTGDRLPPASRKQQVLNLALPACYAHVRDAICAVLDEYRIDYIKWDHNRDLVDAGGGDRHAPVVHEQTLAFYRLVDELVERYPGLEIESCSSGGGRIDLEVIERTARVWTSDDNDPHERQQINRWTMQLLPPELLGMHIAAPRSHTTDRTHLLSFRAITALFGHLGVEWNLLQASDADKAELRDWIALHRAERELLHTGRLVRRELPGHDVWTTGVIAPDASRAMFAVAVLGRASTASAGPVPLPGLVAATRYRVEPVIVGGDPRHSDPAPWVADGPLVMTGAALAHLGVMMPILPPDQAVLLRVTAEA